ncbi:MAG: DUF853 family protein, partial [Gammaproteobacteria bacterium]|nr:DUF853 family protein [Gammaproteobacteria bacterium]
QHALRAYTPREEKAVKTAADTFRPNPDFDTFDAITKLGVGEALVSTLQAKGVPSMVQRTLIRPPSSRLGPLTDAERAQVVATSPVAGQYDKAIDRESAYEVLAKRAEDMAKAEEEKRKREEAEKAREAEEKEREAEEKKAARRSSSGYQRQTVTEAAMKSIVRSVSTSLGRALVRGILGSLRR